MLSPALTIQTDSLFHLVTGQRFVTRFGMVVAVLILFAAPAFGQTDYSDAWLDDSNPDALTIVAVGVTDQDYSGDEIGVEVRLTSPQGRTAAGYGEDYGSAIAEIDL